MANPSTVGVNVRRLRGSETQTALAKRAGLHRMGVAKIETGATQRPNSETLAKLADALKVTVDTLLTPAKTCDANPRGFIHGALSRRQKASARKARAGRGGR